VSIFLLKSGKKNVAAFNLWREMSMVQACYLKNFFVEFFPEYRRDARFSGTPQFAKFRATLEPFIH